MKKHNEATNEVRSRYSLQPHQKREILKRATNVVALSSTKAVERQDIQEMATAFRVSLKLIHEILSHHHIPLNGTETVERLHVPCSRAKLKLSHGSHPNPVPEPLPAPVLAPSAPSPVVLVTAYQIRKEGALERRERALERREKLLEQDRYEVDILLEKIDVGSFTLSDVEARVSEATAALRKEVGDLQETVRRFEKGVPRNADAVPVKLMSYGVVNQMVQVAVMEALKAERERVNYQPSYPDSMAVY